MAARRTTVELAVGTDRAVERDRGWALSTARSVLRDVYGLSPLDATELGGEIDRNIAVTCAGGQRLVVKIGPPDADLGQLAWQHELLRGLHERSVAAPGTLPALPQPVRAPDGSDVTLVSGAGDVRSGDGRAGHLHPVRVHTWLPGCTMAELGRHAPALLQDWGRAAGQLVNALPREAAGHPPHTHHWDALRAPQAIESVVWAVTDTGRVADVERIVGRFEQGVAPVIDRLPRQVVHQDLNDFNVLAARDPQGRHRLAGVLDFGDALFTARVSELAVAVAYAMLRKPDPLAAAAEVVRGYCESTALDDAELRVLFPLAAARLCVNAVTWTARQAAQRGLRPRPDAAHLAGHPPSRPARAVLRRGLLARRCRGHRHTLLRRAEQCGVQSRHRPHPTSSPRRSRRSYLPYCGVRTTARRRPCASAPTSAPRVSSLPLAGTVVRNDAGVLVLQPRHRPTGVVPLVARDVFCTRRRRRGGRPAAGHRRHRARHPVHRRRRRALAPEQVAWTAAPAWRRLCPGPRRVMGGRAVAAPAPADPLARRTRHFARSQRHYYDDPPSFVSSADVWLHDDRGLAYLDVMNNVAHVGHANPAVVAAAHAQSQLLNTNSRLVYPGIADYAERLAALLPDPLEVVFLVCTGSEANDLALRIARQVTGRTDVLVIDGAYHGNTAADTAVSPNRYRGPGGQGVPAGTHEVAQPGPLPRPVRLRRRGRRRALRRRRRARPRCARRRVAARRVHRRVADGHRRRDRAPTGYLAAAFAAVRAAGGLCISRRGAGGVRPAGRVLLGVPDPGRRARHRHHGQAHRQRPPARRGGDHPGHRRRVRHRHEVLQHLRRQSGVLRGRRGGSRRGPAARVAGRAPTRWVRTSRPSWAGWPRGTRSIGDVRGLGLYLGVDLVRDRASKEPAAAEARHLSERLKDEGVLTYPTGVHDNVLKIKPPLTFTREHADLLVRHARPRADGGVVSPVTDLFPG